MAPLGALSINRGNRSFHIAHGDHIAQMIAAPAIKTQFELSEALSDMVCGSDGFGSSGYD